MNILFDLEYNKDLYVIFRVKIEKFIFLKKNRVTFLKILFIKK